MAKGWVVAVMATLVCCLSACSDDGGGSSCTVLDTDAGVTISCSDGTKSTIARPTVTLPDGGVDSAGTCVVTRTASTATIQCGTAAPVTVPVASNNMDGGAVAACVVSESSRGISISCPDGTNATIPGDTLPPLSSLKVVGATTASCGTCHDADRARAHFSVMTVQDEQGLPVETCGTCHNETSLEPVSRAHARPEYAAPGLRVQLGAPAVDPTTRKLTLRFTITEAQGAAIADRTGMSISAVYAKVLSASSATGQPIAGAYQSLLSRSAVQQNTPAYPLDGGGRTASQPSAENTTSGRFVAVGAGTGIWDYTSNYALPADYDAAATYAVAVYATRTVGSVRYVANAERFFVPGSDVALAPPRSVVSTATCNNCHNPLQAHGGSRQDVQLCLTCHTQGAIDPESGNSIDFNVMIHRIHMGKQLPSVVAGGKYSIVGNGLSVHDWSHAAFPQPVANCQVCHTAQDGDRWITNGTREACASCHDNVPMIAPVEVHAKLQPVTNCGNSACHAPNVGAPQPPLGPDALTAHRVSLNTPTAAVLDVKILSVSATVDSAPSVRFSAYTGTRATGAGPVDAGAPLGAPVSDPNALSLLEAFLNGPNTGYLKNGNNLVRVPKEQLVGLAPVPGAPGEFTFALPKTTRELLGLGPDAEDEADPAQQSYTLSLRAQYDPTPGVAPDTDRVDMLRNPSAAFSPTASARPRPPVVLTDSCNKCHGELTAHGGANLAKNVEQCVMCHTGSLDTRVRQAANKQAGPTTSLRFATLIHRIHGGAIATAPYRVFGFNPAGAPFPVLDFSELGFPGDAKVCTTCHAPGTYFLPLPEADPPTRTVSLDDAGVVIGP